ncbi:hypothetical protein YC2023_112558 [Brassica napus]
MKMILLTSSETPSSLLSPLPPPDSLLQSSPPFCLLFPAAAPPFAGELCWHVDAGWVFFTVVLSVFGRGVCPWLALARSFVAGFLFLFSLGLSVVLPVTARESQSGAIVEVFASVCVQVRCCGPRVTLAFPNKDVGFGGGGRRFSILSGFCVLGGISSEEVFLAGPTALYEPWVQRVYTVTGWSRVFQGLRAPFSPVARGDW